MRHEKEVLREVGCSCILLGFFMEQFCIYLTARVEILWRYSIIYSILIYHSAIRFLSFWSISFHLRAPEPTSHILINMPRLSPH